VFGDHGNAHRACPLVGVAAAVAFTLEVLAERTGGKTGQRELLLTVMSVPR
jgi:hypothetical protein